MLVLVSFAHCSALDAFFYVPVHDVGGGSWYGRMMELASVILNRTNRQTKVCAVGTFIDCVITNANNRNGA